MRDPTIFVHLIYLAEITLLAGINKYCDLVFYLLPTCEHYISSIKNSRARFSHFNTSLNKPSIAYNSYKSVRVVPTFIYQENWYIMPNKSKDKAAHGKVVDTQQGPVKGYLSDHGDYFEFFGIPYATAPKGNDKFKAPLAPPTWKDIFEATNNKIACHQPAIGFLSMQFTDATPIDDSLVINVFVPNTDKTNLPVIVYVHGGGFFMGVGNMTNHEPLLRRDVIVVNFNYRLGVCGFLCLGTKDIPGNAGLKDQVAALRWVKKNIACFGGNSDNITIGGGSAGSVSVEHLMLSPMTKGLFAKVFAESGSALTPWAVTPDPIQMAKRYMKDISGKSSDNIFEIENFYKSLTNEQLTEKIYMTEPDTMLGFCPCVEVKIEGEESFYNESPLEIIESGKYNKVPFMPGFATEEGLFRIGLFDEWSEKMEANFSDYLPQDLMFNDEKEKKGIAEAVKKFYFKSKPVNIDTIKQYVDYFTDSIYGYSIAKSARLHARNSVPVYLYDFGYITSNEVPYPHNDKIKGAGHSAQSGVVHKFTFNGPTSYTSDDLLMQDRLATMWTNFAKYGTPVTSTSELLPAAWEPVDPDRLNYLHMDMQFEARDHLLGERYKFWDDIYREHYRKPISTSTIVKGEPNSRRSCCEVI